MTFPKAPDTVFTERAGVIQVAWVVNAAKCLWRETPMHDVGIDGQIEYVDSDNHATGRTVLAQIKSGVSYFARRSSSLVTYTPEAKHIAYWERSAWPVILILHNPAENLTCWIDARDRIRAGERDLQVPVTSTFDVAAVYETLKRDGPLPSGAFDVDRVIAEMIHSQHPSAYFPVDFLDLFVHGLLELGRSVYFGMDMVTDLTQIAAGMKHGSAWGIGEQEYNFLYDYVRYLITMDLARIDFDNFRRWWEWPNEFVSAFLAPLTLRGQALVQRISDLDPSPDIRVVQDKAFQGIMSFEYMRRIPVVESFKAQFTAVPGGPSGAHLPDRPDTGAPEAADPDGSRGEAAT